MPDQITGTLRGVNETPTTTELLIRLNEVTPEQLAALRARVGRMRVEVEIEVAHITPDAA